MATAGPGMTLSTPAGRPASAKISAISAPETGVSSEGFRTNVFPAASAKAIFFMESRKGDAGDDAKRAADGHGNLARLAHGIGLAHGVADIAGGTAQQIGNVIYFPQRLAIDGTAFLDQRVANFRRAAQDDVADLQQQCLALGDQGIAPEPACFMGGGDGVVDLFRPGLLHACEHSAGGGVKIIDDAVARGADPVAVDEQLVGGNIVDQVKSVGMHVCCPLGSGEGIQ
jgi:hypothetical protein